MSVSLFAGDITLANVDAIINAANPQLLGGGGVDGAIHRAAGPALLEACKHIPDVDGVRCPFGEARYTEAGKLSARYVIHTVGPIYARDPQPAETLTRAYTNSFKLALKMGCTTIAVPAISCGVYGYPHTQAADIAISVASTYAASLSITFYLTDRDVMLAFEQALSRQQHAQQ